MKTLITNIKINAIKLVSGGGLCGCSSEDGRQRSLPMERNNTEECKSTCCKTPSNWDMAHFIHDMQVGSKPIRMYCPKKITSELVSYSPPAGKSLLDDIDYYISGK